MFIQVNERPLNVYSVLYYYTREIVTNGVTTYGLYYRLTDGRVLEEIFETEEARALQVEELGNATLGGLIQEDTFSDFPESGSKGAIYLAKDTGQMWFWDEALEQYEKIGVSRKGGVYQYSKDLPSTIGSTVEIAKEDLDILIEPSVPFMDGSEVTAHNAIRGIITKSTDTHVTVRTIADMVIDSFVQVANKESLPAKGELNVLYFIQDLNTFTTWNGTDYDFSDSARTNGNILVYLDNKQNLYNYTELDEYFQQTLFPKIKDKSDLYRLVFIVHDSNNVAILTTDANSTTDIFNYFGYSIPTVSLNGAAGDKQVSFISTSNQTIQIRLKADGRPYVYERKRSSDMRGFLSTSDNREDRPFVPTKLNHPTNKNYVDSIVVGSVNTTIDGLLTDNVKNMFINGLYPKVILAETNQADYSKVTYHYSGVSSANGDNTTRVFYNTYVMNDPLRTTSPNRLEKLLLSLTIIINNETKEVTYETKKETTFSLDLLTTNNKNSYTPIDDYNPATKKYVDDSADTLRNESDANIAAAEQRMTDKLSAFKDTYSIFKGTEGEYTALTQEQRDNYFLAVVEPFITEDRIDLNVMEEILIDETPTETVIDLTYNETEALVDAIIVGGEE